MAGDWIPVFVETPNKPELLQIAESTGRSREECLGFLIRFWLWAQSVTEVSRLSVTCSSLVVVIGADKRFWEAVETSGWIVESNGFMELPNASEWLSRGGKARLRNRMRQQTFRDKAKGITKKNVTLQRYENHTTEQKRSVSVSVSVSVGGKKTFEELSPYREQKVEPLPPHGLENGVYEPLTEDLLRSGAAMFEWHARQAGSREPVLPPTVEAAILVRAAAITALKLRAGAVRVGRVAVFIGIVKKKSWKRVGPYVKSALEDWLEWLKNQKQK